MINKINTTISFKTNPNNNLVLTEMQNGNGQKIQKDFLQKHYNNLYVRDQKVNNSAVGIFSVVSLLCFIGSIVAKKQEYKSDLLFSSAGCALSAAVTYLFRPKKEKYDAQVQIDLNNEVADANISNK